MTDLIARLKVSQIELCRLAADELERLTPTEDDRRVAQFNADQLEREGRTQTAALLRKYVLREKT